MKIREDIITKQDKPDKLIGVGFLIQSIPLPFVYWFLTLGTFGIAFILWIFAAYLALMAKVIFCLGVSAIVSHIGLSVYNKVHYVKRNNAQTRTIEEESYQATIASRKMHIANETALAKLDMYRQLPPLASYAMDNGLNVKYGGLEVTNWKSHIASIQGSTDKIEQIAAPDFVPDPFKFSDVLQNGFRPTKDGILLGKKEDMILCPIGEGLCHTTFTGNTDSGKTSDSRLILIQLLYLREVVFICDKNYQSQRVDKKSGIVYDYRPIERLLSHDPITESKEALNFLSFVIQELDRRRALRRHEYVDFPDWYVFVDELPAFCSEESEIMKHVGRIVREARQYGVFFVGAAQDMLLNTLGGDNGAVRKNFLTNFYGGGDVTTARMMLNLANGENLDENGLGKMGVKYIRAKGAGIEKVKARVPLSDNLAIHMLLTDLVPLPQIEIPEIAASSDSSDDLDRVYDACMQLKEQGLKVTTDTVTEVVKFSRGKVGKLMKELTNQGIEIR